LLLTLTGAESAGSNYPREEVMLLLFKGPYRIAAQLIVGIALVVVGLVVHAALAAGIGGVLILWGLYNAITGRRPGRGA
jgi:hypothetical protein